MAYHLLTSALRGTSRSAAPRLFGISRLFPRQVAHVGVKGLTPSTSTTIHGGVCTTSFATRRLSDIAAPVQRNIRLQLEGHIGELFKDDQISPAFLSPALPPTPAKDLSEASNLVEQLKGHHALIIQETTVQHPLISVTHEELIKPIMESAKAEPDPRSKPVVFVTRGSGTGKTRALVESQLALMQHEDKNILPIAITFNSETKISHKEAKLHQDPDMAYAIMVCSRVLAAFYAKDTPEEIRNDLKEMVIELVSSKFELAARHLFQATLAHVVRRMRKARPDRPVDTVVLMVDETLRAHKAIDGAKKISNPVATDYSSNLRQALLDHPLLPDDEQVGVAVCISSLVPLDETTLSGRSVVALPLAGSVDAEKVVNKWWLPKLLGEKEAGNWIENSANALDRQRLVVLAQSMASVPRLLEFALVGLKAHFKDNGGILRTETDTYRQVMEVVSGAIRGRYDDAELSLDVLRAAIYRKRVKPVLSVQAVNTEGDRWKLSMEDLATAISNSVIVNDTALVEEKSFTPELSLLMASHCMRMGNISPEPRVHEKNFLQRLGNQFVGIPLTGLGDSLEMCTAWMLMLRLFLLRPAKNSDPRRITLRQIFGLGEYEDDEYDDFYGESEVTQLDDGTDGLYRQKLVNLPDLQLALKSFRLPSRLPGSQQKRSAFFEALNRITLTTGQALFWPELAKGERFDHLLAISVAVQKADQFQAAQDGVTNQDGLNYKPFLVFIDDKSRHPLAESTVQQLKSDQAEYVRDQLLRDAMKQTDVTPGSLLEALKEGRCCFIYHQVARLTKVQNRAAEDVITAQDHMGERNPSSPEAQDHQPKLDVYHLDEEASKLFLGPMQPIYKAVRAACQLHDEIDAAKAAK